MLSYTKLSGNARRFKTLMGMSLQEFDLLFAKVEKAHPEAERLSKRPRRRAIGAGRRFALSGAMQTRRWEASPGYTQAFHQTAKSPNVTACNAEPCLTEVV